MALAPEVEAQARAVKEFAEKSLPHLNSLFPNGKWKIEQDHCNIVGALFQVSFAYSHWGHEFVSVTALQNGLWQLRIFGTTVGDFRTVEEAITRVGNIGYSLTTAERTPEALKARFMPEELL